MKAGLLALVVSVSVTAWSYAKLQGRTGYGNAKTTIKGAAIIFALTFAIAFTIGLIVLH